MAEDLVEEALDQIVEKTPEDQNHLWSRIGHLFSAVCQVG